MNECGNEKVNFKISLSMNRQVKKKLKIYKP